MGSHKRTRMIMLKMQPHVGFNGIPARENALNLLFALKFHILFCELLQSLSARRGWIEMQTTGTVTMVYQEVPLRKERVD